LNLEKTQMAELYNKTNKMLAFLEVIGALTIIGYWIGWYADILNSIRSITKSIFVDLNSVISLGKTESV
ncbi:MAG: hypothetical protein ACTSQH_03195, partial [Candidatus Hodarchaeales archaeon]